MRDNAQSQRPVMWPNSLTSSEHLVTTSAHRDIEFIQLIVLRKARRQHVFGAVAAVYAALQAFPPAPHLRCYLLTSL